MKKLALISSFESSILYALISALLVLLTPEARSQEILWSPDIDHQIDRTVDSLMREHHFPGVALAIVYKGKILKEAYYGLASIEFMVPVSDSTVFWLGSISKQFDCTGIMLLQQEGKLDITDSIVKYLPDIPENWRDITIRQLMTHTSGLPFDGTDSSRGENSVREDLVYTSELMYSNMKKDTLSFTPGDRFQYSGAGYSLLSLIMEKVSGKSYAEFMEKDVLQRAGLHHSYTMDVINIHPNQATGYRYTNNKLQLDRNDFRLINKELGAGGAIYTTLKDMILWNDMLNKETLLTSSSKNKMWTSFHLNNQMPTYYGFGWEINKINDELIVSHTGISGTEYIKFVDKGLDMIIFSNLGQPQILPIGTEISRILDVFPIVTPESLASLLDLNIDTTSQDKKLELTGKYKGKYSGFDLNASIEIKDKSLMLNYKEYEVNLKLYPLNDGSFLAYDNFNYFPRIALEQLVPINKSGKKTIGFNILVNGSSEGYLNKVESTSGTQ